MTNNQIEVKSKHPHKKQGFVDSKVPQIIVKAGRRSGKTILSEDFLSVWKVSQPSRARIPFYEGFRVVVQDQVIVTIVGRRDKKKGIKR